MVADTSKTGHDHFIIVSWYGIVLSSLSMVYRDAQIYCIAEHYLKLIANVTALLKLLYSLLQYWLLYQYLDFEVIQPKPVKWTACCVQPWIYAILRLQIMVVYLNFCNSLVHHIISAVQPVITRNWSLDECSIRVLILIMDFL